MSNVRIALANLRFPASPDESVEAAEQAITDASKQHADLICFPECFVPGYRGPGKTVPPPDQAYLERAWTTIAAAAARANIAVVLGTERVLNGALLATVPWQVFKIRSNSIPRRITSTLRVARDACFRVVR